MAKMATTPVRAWRVERQRYLYRDRWLTHRADRCVTERGEVLDPFHVFEFTDWVNVIALTADRQVLLVDEYRHGVGEVVRGFAEWRDGTGGDRSGGGGGARVA